MSAAALDILQLGARSPVAPCAEAHAAAVRAAVSRIGLHPFLVDWAGEPVRCGYDDLLDQPCRAGARIAVLLRAALREVDEKLRAHDARFRAASVLVVLPEERPGFGAAERAGVLGALRGTALQSCPNVQVEAAGEGHAGGIRALELARRYLGEQRCEVCVIVGADSYLDAHTLDWLQDTRQLARAGVRGGFVPGEAAAALAVTTSVLRRQLRLSALARVRGIGMQREARSPSSDEGLLGEGLTAAVEAMAESMDRSAERIDNVFCDINGQRHRTDEWGFTLLRSGALFRDGTAYVSTAAACGDVGAASALLGCLLATRAWHRRYADGRLALVWASSPAGLRGAVLLEQVGGGS